MFKNSKSTRFSKDETSILQVVVITEDDIPPLYKEDILGFHSPSVTFSEFSSVSLSSRFPKSVEGSYRRETGGTVKQSAVRQLAPPLYHSGCYASTLRVSREAAEEAEPLRQ